MASAKRDWRQSHPRSRHVTFTHCRPSFAGCHRARQVAPAEGRRRPGGGSTRAGSYARGSPCSKPGSTMRCRSDAFRPASSAWCIRPPAPSSGSLQPWPCSPLPCSCSARSRTSAPSRWPGFTMRGARASPARRRSSLQGERRRPGHGPHRRSMPTRRISIARALASAASGQRNEGKRVSGSVIRLRSIH